MEDSSNRNYVNISNRKFSHTQYDTQDENFFSYKPTSTAFWVSLESDDPQYHSEWEEEYDETFVPDKNGNLYATTVRLKPTTYVMNPGNDKDILESFNSLVKKKELEGIKLSNSQKRELLVDFVNKLNHTNYENVICQIDLIEDISAMEKIFGDFEFGKEYPTEVYDSLAMKIKNAFRQNFSGVEVTGFALGLEDYQDDDGLEELLVIRSVKDNNYHETIDYFEIHSMAIFDTSCVDIVREVEYQPTFYHNMPDESDIIPE